MGVATSERGRARQSHGIGLEILRSVAEKGALQCLTEPELEFTRYPVTRPARAIPVRAWVRYGDHAVRVEGEIVAWTDRAAAVRWPVPKIGVHKTWVWMSAVDELPDRG